MDWLVPGELTDYLLVAVVGFLVTAVAVLTHYEGLHWLARHYAGQAPRRRGEMLKIIFALLGLHVVEIWCYGLTYWGLAKIPAAGFVSGEHGADTVFDAVYLSAITFSTVGFGDLAPVGPIRLVSGLESLTGLLLITWSASFTYLEMSRLWRQPPA